MAGAKCVISDYRSNRVANEADLAAEAPSFFGSKEVGVDLVRFDGKLGNGVAIKRGRGSRKYWDGANRQMIVGNAEVCVCGADIKAVGRKNSILPRFMFSLSLFWYFEMGSNCLHLLRLTYTD